MTKKESFCDEPKGSAEIELEKKYIERQIEWEKKYIERQIELEIMGIDKNKKESSNASGWAKAGLISVVILLELYILLQLYIWL